MMSFFNAELMGWDGLGTIRTTEAFHSLVGGVVDGVLRMFRPYAFRAKLLIPIPFKLFVREWLELEPQLAFGQGCSAFFCLTAAALHCKDTSHDGVGLFISDFRIPWTPACLFEMARFFKRFALP